MTRSPLPTDAGPRKANVYRYPFAKRKIACHAPSGELPATGRRLALTPLPEREQKGESKKSSPDPPKAREDFRRRRPRGEISQRDSGVVKRGRRATVAAGFKPQDLVRASKQSSPGKQWSAPPIYVEEFNDWGGWGYDDFIPGEVTKTAPSGDRTT